MLGLDVAVNKPVDFLVQKNDTPLFYLESTVATGSKDVLTNQRKIWELIDVLNTLKEPYFQVSIEVEQESLHNLQLSQIRSGVHQWLQTLDPDQVSEQRKTPVYDEHPHYSWELDGWKIDFFAIPRPPEDRGTPGETVLYHMRNAQWVEAQNSLRNALESKANRYGVLQLPYVIAVDVLALDSFGSAAGEVLFGKGVILFNTQSEEITLTGSPLLPNRPRSENGLWTARRRPRNRQISAVLLVDELMAWSVAHKTPILWHNPWAEKPLDSDLWQGPQMIPDKDASSPQMRYREGKEAFEILHLPLDWPDNDLENQSRVDK